MNYLATQPAIERPDLRPIEARTSQFGLAVIPEQAQWLYAAFDELRELKQRGGTISGFGDFRISDETYLRAKILLARSESREDLPEPLISVFSGGGVSLTWHLGRKELGYKIFPNGAIVFMQLVDDEIIDDGDLDLSQESRPSQLVKWLLQAKA